MASPKRPHALNSKSVQICPNHILGLLNRKKQSGSRDSTRRSGPFTYMAQLQRSYGQIVTT